MTSEELDAEFRKQKEQFWLGKTKFDTGAVRDKQDGKPNFYECMSPLAYWRYGEYMLKASAKYGPDNWTKGIPIESYIQSLERHLVKLKAELKYGIFMEKDVDHAAAIMFNVMGLMHEQEKQRFEIKNHNHPQGLLS